ncbi:hypothetical protein GN244_ATG17514 [Phytophthora infestans]|uniref:Uncharacterized protein n=1 Tax=Phytophthora infestans TaxID=4787 RepID=A0A833S1I4_PHYIN|nr:hypothetical protein GN244_ATG17514 [Phytophthora infestans]
MVEREAFSDEAKDRVFDRSLEGGVDEQLVPVPAAVERLKRGARVRVSQDPRSGVEQSPSKSDGSAESRRVATMSISSETDDEPEIKGEVVFGASTRSEGPYTTDGNDSEYYDVQETYDSEYDAAYEKDKVVKCERKPNGFISRYAEPESRRSDRPAFGWSLSARREESGVRGLRGGYGPGMAAKPRCLRGL